MIDINLIEKILNLCSCDEEIAKVVGVLDMVWARDKNNEILTFKTEDFNKLAKTITNVRAGKAYRLKWVDYLEEYELVEVVSED